MDRLKQTMPEALPYARQIAATRAARVTRLRSDTGWLSVVGKVFLDRTTPAVRVGSAPDCEARLPMGAPAFVGTLRIEHGLVRITLPYGSPGAPRERVLGSDRDGKADSLDAGGFRLEVMERGDVFALRVRDVRELPRPFAGIDYFPVDIAWRKEARLVPHTQATALELDYEGPPLHSASGGTAADISDKFESPGVLVFDAAEGEQRLTAVYTDGARARLYVLFRDGTAPAESYPTGRFLYAAPPDASGRVVLDFNEAMIPGCAFSIHATCPIPPRDNRLSVRIPAGEKNYLGDPVG